MKNSVPIPSDVWEEKKALIATLYKDEEWPLKQVIKKIRSDNFNPSETQLRSRLKKWRVTKPSRQTRKKSEEATRDTAREVKNSNSPHARMRLQLPTSTQAPVTEAGWYMANKTYDVHGLPTIPIGAQDMPSVWGQASSHPSPLSSPGKSRVSSNASLAISTSTSYDPSQTSPLVDGALLNPTPAVTPTFASASYAVNADPCMQTSVSTTATVPSTEWAMPQWYQMSMDATTRASSMPFYVTGPLTPPIDPMMQMMSPHNSHQVPEFHEGLKSWKRTLSAPYNPEMGVQVGHKIRQGPKSLERNLSLPPKISTRQYTSGTVTPTSPYYPQGQHLALCSPGYIYSGPESLDHRSNLDLKYSSIAG
ncbi:hypothetical protein BJY04DRAFT_223972 [Aspergillus karnatakaensis]|uniref:Clr5 domain-containing protein n=1 Tax=Aspergillus karnatakaensis TaxID=1810916 RepID=UPI003CCD0C10